ncbi:MAG: 16S rRNA (guanine(966)-N(2))-methyltransferase RsmD [Clostridia bacterium]|nr:16S rRNA (guanine(966)-N(2))-methyltransferase RsmD [Clostridia bacterium]
MMRIITGRARGVRLETLAGENTRPTSERAKEAIFSMLQFELQDKEVLDLFAGSGQMGLEALSRGARHACLCDTSRDAVKVIRANTLKTKLAPMCEVVSADWTEALRAFRRKYRFDLVFLDPPYALGVIPSVLERLCKDGLLASDAIVVCEAGSADAVFDGNEDLMKKFEILKQTRYGVAFVTLLRVKNQEEVSS